MLQPKSVKSLYIVGNWWKERTVNASVTLIKKALGYRVVPKLYRRYEMELQNQKLPYKSNKTVFK